MSEPRVNDKQVAFLCEADHSTAGAVIDPVELARDLQDARAALAEKDAEIERRTNLLRRLRVATDDLCDAGPPDEPYKSTALEVLEDECDALLLSRKEQNDG